VLGGVEGLAEMVGEERANWTETEDMEAHWPVWMSRGRVHQTEPAKESTSFFMRKRMSKKAKVVDSHPVEITR
jgi:hypothetical protein